MAMVMVRIIRMVRMVRIAQEKQHIELHDWKIALPSRSACLTFLVDIFKSILGSGRYRRYSRFIMQGFAGV